MVRPVKGYLGGVMMIDGGKRNLLGILIDVVDYEAAVERIIAAVQVGQPMG